MQNLKFAITTSNFYLLKRKNQYLTSDYKQVRLVSAQPFVSFVLYRSRNDEVSLDYASFKRTIQSKVFYDRIVNFNLQLFQLLMFSI